MKKQGNEVALRQSASLAALAWSRLEQAARATLKANGSPPTLQLTADTGGITALIRDEFGSAVMVQSGKISMQVATQE